MENFTHPEPPLESNTNPSLENEPTQELAPAPKEPNEAVMPVTAEERALHDALAQVSEFNSEKAIYFASIRRELSNLAFQRALEATRILTEEDRPFASPISFIKATAHRARVSRQVAKFAYHDAGAVFDSSTQRVTVR